MVRDTEQGEGGRRLMRWAGVARQSLVRGKPIMSPLCSREDHRQGMGKSLLGRGQVYLDAAPSAKVACRRVDASCVASLARAMVLSHPDGDATADSPDEDAWPGVHATDTVDGSRRSDSPRFGRSSTRRRLPSASRRRSPQNILLPVGQRRLPSGWREKSFPVKRPAFQEAALVGSL